MRIAQHEPLPRLEESIWVDETHVARVLQFQFRLLWFIERLVGATIDEVSISLEGHAPIGSEFTVVRAKHQAVFFNEAFCLATDFAEHFIACFIRLDYLELVDRGERVVDGEVLGGDLSAIDYGKRHQAAMHEQPCGIAVERDVPQVLQENSAAVNRALLVVGDVAMELLGIIGEEMVFPAGAEDDLLVAVRRSLP